MIGEWGTGKTTFASTFPDPIYFFDMDMGLVGLRDTTKHIEYDTYFDDDLKRPTAANGVEKKTNELMRECQYKTVVYDTTTNLSDIFMNRILYLNGRAGQTPQLQDYFKLMTDFKQLIYRSKTLPAHVIFIAHEHVDKDEVSGGMRSVPLLSGKLASRLGGMFNEVYYASVLSKKDGPEYRLLTQPLGIRKGKTQMGKGNFDIYEKPDFEHLIAKVNS